MNHLLIKIYHIFPKTLRNKLGQRTALKLMRDLFLKEGGHYREGDVYVEKDFLNYRSRFRFFASIKDAAKAKHIGIEHSLLLNSFRLVDTYKPSQKDLVILDVGANFGYLSLVWATTLCKPQGQVIAFEPSPYVHASFQKSIAANTLGDVITLNKLAVGAENSTIKLYLDNTTSNTIPSPKELPVEIVEMTTLDSYYQEHKLLQCDLIKIDVDGIELAILQGSRDIIKNFSPLLIVETNDDHRIVDFFIDLNYDILDMELKPYTIDAPLPINIFCVPKPI